MDPPRKDPVVFKGEISGAPTNLLAGVSENSNYSLLRFCSSW